MQTDSGTKKIRRPELLVPAGSPEGLRCAVRYGADAVYLGGEAYGLRAMAKNFTEEEMAEGIRYAHERGVKVYVTANILAHNADLEGARGYFAQLRDLRPEAPDALIIADPGMVRVCRQVWPEAVIHISTQANNTNYETFRFWQELGAKRVVGARELTLREIAEIREKIPEEMEIECFVHGSMCVSYSGRCLLSGVLTGRDANRGACTHPCRWSYALMEETRPGEYFPVEENERGTFVFNSRDLCMVDHVPELVQAGIDSFKIEGRMKNALYVATVARTYRKAIDCFLESRECYEAHLPWLKEQIAMCTFRPYGTGFYFGRPAPGEEGQIYDGTTYKSEAVFLGIARAPEGGETVFDQKNKFSVGDPIEVMKPDGRDLQAVVTGMRNAQGEEVPACPHAGERIRMRLSDAEGRALCAEEGDVLRMRGSRE